MVVKQIILSILKFPFNEEKLPKDLKEDISIMLTEIKGKQ